MFELVFLGTSASAPSVRRGLSSAMVFHDEYRFLVDCGEGTQRQLLKSGVGFKRLDKILITHGHLDHILGLGGLMSTFARWESIDRVQIYGGLWALQRIRALMEVVFGEGIPPIEIEYVELQPGVLLEDRDFELSAFPVSHRGPGCFGFVFREKEKRPFQADLAEALAVPAGPERARLVRGETITLADGRVITPDDVLGIPIEGAKLVFVGDAGSTDGLLEVSRHADALVIEATYLQDEGDMARRFGHLTATQAAKFAAEAGVRLLILTHVSRRYADRQLLDEATRIFPDTVVASDFDHFRIVKQH
jgi:ribonuclease Z